MTTAKNSHLQRSAQGSVQEKIRAELGGMSPGMRKVAQWLLEHMHEVISSTIVELAERAETSPSMLSRLCQRAGVGSFSQLKVAVAADLGRAHAADSWVSGVSQPFGHAQPLSDTFNQLLGHHMKTLENTARQIDLGVIGTIAQACANARRIDLYGIGGSALLARDLQERFHRIGLVAYWWEEVHAGVTSAALLDQDCVAIAVSNSGRTREILEMAKKAKESGALTVALTHHPRSPLVQICDLAVSVLVDPSAVENYGPTFRQAGYLLSDILYVAVAQAHPQRTVQTLKVTAKAVEHLRFDEEKFSPKSFYPGLSGPLTKEI